MFLACKPRFQVLLPRELGLPNLARASLILLLTSSLLAYGTRGHRGGRLCALPSCRSTGLPAADKQQCIFGPSRGLPRYHPHLVYHLTEGLYSKVGDFELDGEDCLSTEGNAER